MLVHTVLFNLNPEMNAEQRAAFEADARALGKIEVVRQIHLGKPAATPPRDAVKSDYDYMLTVIVDNVRDHDIYQDHQLHHRFVARHKEFFIKIQVFDAD